MKLLLAGDLRGIKKVWPKLLLLGVVLGCAVDAQEMLTNETIIKLVSSGVSSATIIKTIAAADSVEFRFLTDDLQRLQKNNVPDDVLKAMAARAHGTPIPGVVETHSPESPAPPPPPPAEPATPPLSPRPSETIILPSPARPMSTALEIPEGTKVRVRLEQQLSSAIADENQPVTLAVADDVVVNDTVVIPHDAAVNGTVVESVKKRRMGRTGKLDFSIDTIILPDGNKVAVRYSLYKKEGGSHAVRTGIITAGVAVLFWPAAPFVLLAHGKDTVIQKGTTYEVFTDTRYTPKLKSEAGSLAAPATTAIVINSDPTGADIEVDGSFVGNSPSNIQLTSGQHVIKITKGRKSWQRTINVLAGSSLNLSATLEESPPHEN